MKVITILLIIFCTTACSPNEVEFAQARFACKDKGGLFKIGYGLVPAARCNNGEMVDMINTIVITDPKYFNKQGKAE